jgi:hypothetical protein
MAEKVEDTITDHQKHRIGIISATTPFFWSYMIYRYKIAIVQF